MTTINVKALTNTQLINLQESITDELKVRLTVGRYKPQPITPEVPKAPTTREDVIQAAKNVIHTLKGNLGCYNIGTILCHAEFIVNTEKRTVVCLLKGYTTKTIYHKGIAKCDTTDVFNIHIGKAIALYRALGKQSEIPFKLLDAPQPTESEVGDIVEYHGQIYKVVAQGEWKLNNGTATPNSIVATKGKIINDSKE